MKTKIKLSEIRELVREIIKEEMDAYQPAPDDEKDTEEEKPPHPALVEKHLGFKKLVKQLVKKGIPKEHEVVLREMTDEEIDEGAEALAAWIGRKKYGKKAFQAKAAAGKRKDEAVFTTTKKQCNVCKKPIDATWKPGHLENPNYCQGHSKEERTTYAKATAGKKKDEQINESSTEEMIKQQIKNLEAGIQKLHTEKAAEKDPKKKADMSRRLTDYSNRILKAHYELSQMNKKD